MIPFPLRVNKLIGSHPNLVYEFSYHSRFNSNSSLACSPRESTSTEHKSVPCSFSSLPPVLLFSHKYIIAASMKEHDKIDAKAFSLERGQTPSLCWTLIILHWPPAIPNHPTEVLGSYLIILLWLLSLSY